VLDNTGDTDVLSIPREFINLEEIKKNTQVSHVVSG
jgi:hypothetical protein